MPSSESSTATATGGVGYEFAPVTVAWLKRDLLLYANSIGVRADELHFLYELHPRFQAFPTYPVILSLFTSRPGVLPEASPSPLTVLTGFKEADQEVIPFLSRPSPTPVPGGPPLDPATFVDGERHIKLFKPIPTSTSHMQFELRGKCLGIYDKGKPGTVLVMRHQLVERATGDVYSEVTCSTFAVGQGNWGGSRGPTSPVYAPPKGAKPTATVATETTAQQALLYRLNGDYNPLHADPAVGAQMGFGGVILHGLCTWNIACRAILATFADSDGRRLRSFGGRFASPVRPGDLLETNMWRTGIVDGEGTGCPYEEVLFEVRVAGRLVMPNGRALLKLPPKESRL